jgi:hypothetical protein
LDRDQHKRRNFREETITDMLMAGLVPFEPMGIRVDYPIDESISGEDMDWEFVNENAVDGRRYLRLHIQAKRAICSKGKKPYWFYRELDHALASKAATGGGGKAAGSKALLPKQHGMQHTTLIDEAAKVPGCVPIYMFYHPGSAVEPGNGISSAVEGLNWIFADNIPKNVTTARWPIADRKLAKWRPHFQPLSKLLCFGRSEFVRFNIDGGAAFALVFTQPASPSPGELSDRLNELRSPAKDARSDPVSIRAVEDIPPSTLEAIRSAADQRTGAADIPRPRIIFNYNGA